MEETFDYTIKFIRNVPVKGLIKKLQMILIMKKIIFIFLLTFCMIGYSQNYNYKKELERMVTIPNTPEAAAFAKYGNTSVSMYSGTPNVSVPIYTIQGRELNLPISLSYDATGVKVDQMASNVGLNWNLNFGGRISRRVNGLVDGNKSIVGDSYSSLHNTNNIALEGVLTNKTLREWILDNLTPPSHFPTLNEGQQYFKFLKAVSDNKLDTQPDYFSFNALGINDHFVHNLDTILPINNSFVALDNPRIRVTPTMSAGVNPYITGWTIITENGTTLYFNSAEETISTKDDATSTVVQTYNSSWLLTQIDSPNKKDIYTFTYTDLGHSNTQPAILTTSVTNQLDDDYPQNTSSESVLNTTYTTSQIVLDKITHNGKEVVSVTLKSRNDFNLASAIDKIQILKPNGVLLKEIIFNHSYFGVASQNPFDIRLKLDSITFQSYLNNTLNSYSFDYFSPADVPSRESLRRDYLGLFNDKNNAVLYPKVTVNGIFYSGADRSVDFNKAINGTLQKITHPTKGYTTFSYESNTSPTTLDDITTSIQDVTHGSLNIAGGIGNSGDCGICCIDQYGNAPKVGSFSFNIIEAGNYAIDYSKSNGDGEAYLFFRSRVQNFSPNLDYDEVIEQSSCNELVNMTWSNFGGNNGDFVYLIPGTYQILLVKGYVPSGSGNISLRVHREETTTSGIVGTGDIVRAGIRIKNIKDYDHTAVVTSEKEYQYSTALNGSDSSGEIVFKPSFYTTSNYQVYIASADATKGQVSGMNTLTTMTRVNSWSGGDRPHIAYAKVFEIQKASGLDNGYIEHNFNVGWYNGVFSTGIGPGANLYYKDYKISKENKTSVYKAGSTLLKIDSTTYNNPRHFGSSTLYIKHNVNNTFSYVNLFQYNGTGDYYYSYDPAVFFDFSYSTAMEGSGSNAVPPSSCENCMSSMSYSSPSTLRTYAKGNVGAVLTKSSIDYYDGRSSVQATDYIYDSDNNYLLRETKTLNSAGDTLTSKFSYPEDFASQPYLTMVFENRLTTVIQTESLKDTTTINKQKRTYIDLGNAILPDKIQTAKGTATLEDRLVFERYENDNLVQAKQVNGSSTAYIWGYNKQYPIAKIDNATYADIENLFGNGFEIVDGLSTAQETQLRSLPDAMITTYSYYPMIGVKSITDPNGQTITYHYDEFNRLEFIKDINKKILSQNQYNYKN